jgi:hypothetical protein
MEIFEMGGVVSTIYANGYSLVIFSDLSIVNKVFEHCGGKVVYACKAFVL